MHGHLKFQILAQLVDLMIMQSDVKSRTSSIVIERSGTLATLLLRKILRWEK